LQRRNSATFALCLVLGAASATPTAPPDDPRPNVLVLIADDLGWRDIAPDVPTPTIDRLRERGVSFVNAYANANCSPSRYTCMFGRYSRRDAIGTVVKHKSPRNNPDAPVELVSVAELLGGRGYATAAFGKWHVSSAASSFVNEAPRIHGFDHYVAGSIYGFGEDADYRAWQEINDGKQKISEEYNTTTIATRAAEWWSATRGPKLAWVAFNAPHVPFHQAPAELLPEGYAIEKSPRGKFESAVVALDTELGNLLRVVDFDDTFVLFLGDNGTPTDAAARDQDPTRLKGSVYDGGVRVPFVAAGYGVAASGASSSALVNTTDIFATLAELAGIGLERVLPPGYELDSISFGPSLADTGAAGARRFAYSEFFSPNGTGPKTIERCMVRNARYKLMLDRESELLFDLLADPEERRPVALDDLAALGDDVRRELAELRAHLAALRALAAR
jgi:arylsulfatase A-like enzyme